jgi:hypothetical protein
MDRIKSAVIITLDFFKIIDGFEEEGETNQPGGKEDNCQHTMEFASRAPNWVPDHLGRISSRLCPPATPCNPVKMKKRPPK